MTNKYYNEKALTFFNNTVNIDMTELYQPFLKYLIKGDKILDLGCGSGRDVLFFTGQGFKVVGIDNSEELVKLARKYTKCNIINSNFKNMQYNEEFDAIWACASLLHLTKKEVKDVLKKCYSALKPNGIMYSSFKYGDFEGIRNGRYFTFLDETSFQKILKKISGFHILETWKTEDARNNRKNEYWFNVIIKKQ